MTQLTTISRRGLLASLAGVVAVPLFPRTQDVAKPKALIQTSPVAGFQYHDGERIWRRMKAGDSLNLVREPKNKYDPPAVRVDWRGRKLGYVPRLENRPVAQMLDRGQRLEARISAMRFDSNPWKRTKIAIWLC